MTSNGDDSSSAGGKTDIFSESSSTSPPNTPGPSAAVPSFSYIGDQSWASASPFQKSSLFDLTPAESQQRRTSVENIWNTSSHQPKSSSIWSDGLAKQGLTPVLQDSAFSKDPPFRAYRSFSLAVPNSAKREPIYQNCLPMTSEEDEYNPNVRPPLDQPRAMSSGAVLGGGPNSAAGFYSRSPSTAIWNPVPHVQRDSRVNDLFSNSLPQPSYLDNNGPSRRFSVAAASENIESYKPENFIDK
jgi:hypothetical protein